MKTLTHILVLGAVAAALTLQSGPSLVAQVPAAQAASRAERTV